MSSRSRCGQSRSRQSHETKTSYRADLVEAAVASARRVCASPTNLKHGRRTRGLWLVRRCGVLCRTCRCSGRKASVQGCTRSANARNSYSGALNRLRLSSCTFCQPVVLATTATQGQAIRCTLTDGQSTDVNGEDVKSSTRGRRPAKSA